MYSNFKYLTLLFGLTLPYAGYADTLTVNSHIEHVTLYKKGGMVTRTAKVHLKKGINYLRLNNLTPILDKTSIQVGTDNENVTLVNVNYDAEFARKDSIAAELKKLCISSKLKADSISFIQDNIGNLDKEYELVAYSRNIGGNKGFDAERLKAIASYLRTDLNDINSLQIASEKKDNELQRSIDIEQQQIKALNENESKPYSVIEITLSAPEETDVNINLNYFVTNAVWKPSYELRIDDIEGTPTLQTKAETQQDTKEDWKNIKLSVTQTNPSVNNQMPTLSRYYVPFSASEKNNDLKEAEKTTKVIGLVYDNDGPIKGVIVESNKTGEKVSTDSTGYYEITIPEGTSLIYANGNNKNKWESTQKGNVCLKNIFWGVDVSLENQILRQNRQVKIKAAMIADDSRQWGASEDNDTNHWSLAVHGGVNANKLNTDKYVDKALQGKVAGVNSTSGQPGSAVTMRIHGVSSLTGSGDPLYIVDDIPLDSGTDNSNPLATIDPADIESMEVLKNGSQTAIYGSRAANGVIIIKTKKGAKKKLTALPYRDISIDAEDTLSIPADGADHEVKLKTEDIKCFYTYYAVPKLNNKVYMVANLPDWTQYDLQPGNLKVYYQNAYLGKSYIRPQQTKDTLQISVGTDNDIAVDRKEQKDYTKKSILKNNIKVQKSWLITVKNHKPQTVNVVVEDQYPVSTQKDIEVKLTESSNAKIDKTEGKLTWNIKLAPNEKKELKITYEVTLPKDSNIDVE